MSVITEKRRRTTLFTALALGVVALCVSALVIFGKESVTSVSVIFGVAACGIFFLGFESGRPSARRVATVAVMAALTVVSRVVFAPIPSFKPVTAMVVITAVCLGGESGFMTGAIAALISNFYFGQGPWTPFQMIAWGLIGLVGGLLARPLKRYPILLYIYGALCGVFYSLFLDLYTVMWYSGGFSPSLYFAAVVTSLPHMGIYAVSNTVFLLLLAKPIGKKILRLQTKYGI